MTRRCPACDGQGVIRSEESIAIEFERKLRELVRDARDEAFLVQMNPRVSAQFTGGGSRVLAELEADTGKRFHFEGSEGLPLGHLDIIFRGTRAAVEERALPFREGEQVLVQIVEPHMYDVDDAVAKIDGYIISVRGGGRFVGEKHLVEIEEVGRTAATASIVGQPAAANGDGGDDVQSAARRRGRRGGRRRSRATAGTVGEAGGGAE